MSRWHAAAQLFALVTLASPESLQAQEVAAEAPISFARPEVTSTTTAARHSSSEGYGVLFERLNLSTTRDGWQAGLRVDTATFLAKPSLGLQDRYTLEKAAVGWTGRSLEVTAGDTYVSFGRGLALSLRKIDELGIDTTLRGARVLVQGRRWGGAVAVGVANINNIDEASGRTADDPNDLIGGIQGHVSLSEKVIFGTHGTAFAFRDSLGLVPGSPYQNRYFHLGPTLSAPRLTEIIGFHLEGIAQLREVEGESTASKGFGMYGAGTIYIGSATLLLEGKAYGDLAPVKPRLTAPEFGAVAYNNPPTIERVMQVIENPQREIAGGRAHVDFGLSPALRLFANYGFFRDWLGYVDPLMPGVVRAGTIHDIYLGTERRWNDGRSWIMLTTGWRGVVLDEVRALVRADAHAELDAVQSLGDRWSLTFHLLHLERQKYESPILNHQFRQGTVLAGVSVRPRLTLIGGYDYTTEPTQFKRDYFNGSVEWRFTPSSSIRLFAGSTRGGLRCSSGVCRVFPPFDGVRLTVTIRL